MKCLMLVVMLSLLQTSVTTSKQIGNKGRHQGHNNADTSKNVANPSSGQPPSDSSDKNPNGAWDQNQNNEVKVSSLPREIEVKSLKDSIDKTILACTITLKI